MEAGLLVVFPLGRQDFDVMDSDPRYRQIFHLEFSRFEDITEIVRPGSQTRSPADLFDHF
ncbi:hypothetical protein Bra5_PD00283 (plasmid) [Rhizobium phaseoli Brasil 5]|nr:hypothetical protein Bra5_PD00283 [Rhizobium phaseoli Brasil 5]